MATRKVDPTYNPYQLNVGDVAVVKKDIQRSKHYSLDRYRGEYAGKRVLIREILPDGFCMCTMLDERERASGYRSRPVSSLLPFQDFSALSDIII